MSAVILRFLLSISVIQLAGTPNALTNALADRFRFSNSPLRISPGCIARILSSIVTSFGSNQRFSRDRDQFLPLKAYTPLLVNTGAVLTTQS
jgi:hypothetical protein